MAAILERTDSRLKSTTPTAPPRCRRRYFLNVYIDVDCSRLESRLPSRYAFSVSLRLIESDVSKQSVQRENCLVARLINVNLLK